MWRTDYFSLLTTTGMGAAAILHPVPCSRISVDAHITTCYLSISAMLCCLLVWTESPFTFSTELRCVWRCAKTIIHSKSVLFDAANVRTTIDTFVSFVTSSSLTIQLKGFWTMKCWDNQTLSITPLWCCNCMNQAWGPCQFHHEPLLCSLQAACLTFMLKGWVSKPAWQTSAVW